MSEKDGRFSAEDKYFDSSARLLETQEALFVQHLLRVEDTEFVLSRFSAGSGQASFGDCKARKVDYFGVKGGGKLKIVQFHESHHFVGGKHGHTTKCSLYNDSGAIWIRNSETKLCDEFNLGLCAELTKSGLIDISYDYKTPCDYFHGYVDQIPGSIDTTDFCIHPKWTKKNLSHNQLNQEILNSSDVGFVHIIGGREGIIDSASKTTGFWWVQFSVV